MRTLSVATSLALSFVASCAATPAAPHADLVFTRVNVIDVEHGSVLRERDVSIQGERIVAVERAGRATPRGALVVEGRGRYLMPGLCDAHGHLPDAEPDDALSIDEYLRLQLSSGVTSVRSMRGTERQLALRDEIARGERIGPTLYVAGLVSDVDARTGAQRVRELKAQGYDLVKLLGGVDREAYRAIAAAAASENLPFAGHVPAAVPVADVLTFGQCVEHFNVLSAALQRGAKPDELAKQCALAGVANCPTMTFYTTWYRLEPQEAFERRAGIERMPEQDLEHWRDGLGENVPTPEQQERARRVLALNLGFLRELDRAGARILVSASHGPWIAPGWSMLEEMRLYRAAGLSNASILRAATRSAAEALDEAERWGDVRAGERADLVLLAADPLERIENVHAIDGVLARGRWFPREELERLAPVRRR